MTSYPPGKAIAQDVTVEELDRHSYAVWASQAGMFDWPTETDVASIQCRSTPRRRALCCKRIRDIASTAGNVQQAERSAGLGKGKPGLNSRHKIRLLPLRRFKRTNPRRDW